MRGKRRKQGTMSLRRKKARKIEKEVGSCGGQGRRLTCDPVRKQEKMSWIPHGMRQGVETKPLDLLSGKLW